MTDIERIKPCEDCPMGDVFDAVNEAANSDNEVIKSAGEHGKKLLGLMPENTGPRAVDGTLENFCCRQAQVYAAKSAVERAINTVKKIEKNN